jgi:hypothetical protein
MIPQNRQMSRRTLPASLGAQGEIDLEVLARDNADHGCVINEVNSGVLRAGQQRGGQKLHQKLVQGHAIDQMQLGTGQFGDVRRRHSEQRQELSPTNLL